MRLNSGLYCSVANLNLCTVMFTPYYLYNDAYQKSKVRVVLLLLDIPPILADDTMSVMFDVHYTPGKLSAIYNRTKKVSK